MTFDFAGQRALITGGSRGVGAAVAERLASLGAHVLINFSRDDAAANATLSTIVGKGGSGELVKANVLDPAELRGAIARIGETAPIDILVHAAALGSFKPILDVKPSQWDQTLGVTAKALLIATQAAVPLMPGTGRIVSLSSLGASRVMPDYGAIGVAKAALESLTRYLACELAPRGIRVNAVAAGLIDGTSVTAHPSYAHMRAAALAKTPAARLGCPSDVADAVVFLCSEWSSWIVGQTLVVDGGLSLLV
jgi:enoyl-[acyl-carrier protein] reductase III